MALQHQYRIQTLLRTLSSFGRRDLLSEFFQVNSCFGIPIDMSPLYESFTGSVQPLPDSLAEMTIDKGASSSLGKLSGG
jgi:hypothetical protein